LWTQIREKEGKGKRDREKKGKTDLCCVEEDSAEVLYRKIGAKKYCLEAKHQPSRSLEIKPRAGEKRGIVGEGERNNIDVTGCVTRGFTPPQIG